MSDAIDSLDLQPWYKQFWPWFLISLPATIVVAGIAMIIMAVRSPFAMVEDNYYKAGLGINEDLAASELARTLGISAAVTLDNRLAQVDVNRSNLNNLSLHFIHPTDASRDQTYKLYALGERRFETELSESISASRTINYKVRLVGFLSRSTSTENSSDTNHWMLEGDFKDSSLPTTQLDDMTINLSASQGSGN